MEAILDFTDVKNVMEGKGGKEGREGGDQARFFMWMFCALSHEMRAQEQNLLSEESFWKLNKFNFFLSAPKVVWKLGILFKYTCCL